MRNFKVAIFGTAASYHDLAAQKFYGQEVEAIECFTFRQCCELVKNNHADYAVMAIENSIAGSILSNYNLIDEYQLRIIGEQYLKIELNLLALEGVSMTDIKYIHSHPMALAQCSEFLQKHSHVTIVEEGDTASCVKKIKELNLKNTAAIANELSSLVYGVPVLFSNVENNKQNFTRFIILSKGDSKPEHPNKASVCFRLKHEVGSLSDVLNVLKRNGVSLSKIQSVPVAGEPLEYSFHADLEWVHRTDFQKALKKIKGSTRSLSVLGEYIKANIVN
ncbi:MAG: prephenate dehydratase [Bacteroidetes bacterium]|nr:prephenate dehydratase [Bacteroidota bacterium]